MEDEDGDGDVVDEEVEVDREVEVEEELGTWLGEDDEEKVDEDDEEGREVEVDEDGLAELRAVVEEAVVEPAVFVGPEDAEDVREVERGDEVVEEGVLLDVVVGETVVVGFEKRDEEIGTMVELDETVLELLVSTGDEAVLDPGELEIPGAVAGELTEELLTTILVVDAVDIVVEVSVVDAEMGAGSPTKETPRQPSGPPFPKTMNN